MEIGILTYTTTTGKSILAHTHISKFIREMTGGEIIDQEITPKEFDVLFVVSGMFMFCNFKEIVLELVNKAKYIIYCSNDYLIDIPFKRKPDEVWSTVEGFGEYINWNALTFNRGLLKQNRKHYTDSLFYYGAFRKGREYYFKKYFDTTEYKVYVSANKKQAKKFYALSRRIKFFPLLRNPAEIGIFGTSIYIEDKKSHDTFMSPANRFYEMLSNRVAIAIDEKAEHTLIKGGITGTEKYRVASPRDVKRIIDNYKDVAKEQAEKWANTDYREETKKRFIDLWKKSKSLLTFK